MSLSLDNGTSNQALALLFSAVLPKDVIHSIVFWAKRASAGTPGGDEYILCAANGTAAGVAPEIRLESANDRQYVATRGTNPIDWATPADAWQFADGEWGLYNALSLTQDDELGNVEAVGRSLRVWNANDGDSGPRNDPSLPANETIIGNNESSEYINRVSLGGLYTSAWAGAGFVSNTKYAHLMIFNHSLTTDEFVALGTKRLDRAIADGDIDLADVILHVPFAADFTPEISTIETVTPVASNVTAGANINADMPDLLEVSTDDRRRQRMTGRQTRMTSRPIAIAN